VTNQQYRKRSNLVKTGCVAEIVPNVPHALRAMPSAWMIAKPEGSGLRSALATQGYLAAEKLDYGNCLMAVSSEFAAATRGSDASRDTWLDQFTCGPTLVRADASSAALPLTGAAQHRVGRRT